MWKILVLLTSIVSCHTYGSYYWRDFEDTIPEDAFIGYKNFTGIPVYIATVLIDRVIYAGELIPGVKGILTKYNPTNRTSVALKVLCTKHPHKLLWRPTSTSTFNTDIIGNYPVVGGTRNDNQNRDFFIGRIPHGSIGVIDFDNTIGLPNGTWYTGSYFVLIEIGRN